jgi:hypothetical protein
MDEAAGATDSAFRKIAETAAFRTAQAYNSIRASFVKIGNLFKDFFADSAERWAEWIEKLADFVVEHGPEIKSAIEDVMSAIREFVTDVIDRIGEALSGLRKENESTWDAVKRYATVTWEGLREVATDVWGGISEIIGVVLEWIQGDHANVMDGLVSKARTTYEALKTIWGDLKEFYGPVFKAIGDLIEGNWGAAMDNIAKATEKVIDQTLTILNKAIPKVTEFAVKVGGSIITGILKGIWQAFKDAGKGYYEAVGELLPGLPTETKALAQPMQPGELEEYAMRQRGFGLVPQETQGGAVEVNISANADAEDVARAVAEILDRRARQRGGF